MKATPLVPRTAGALLIWALAFLSPHPGAAQTINSWTNPASGNWEDLKWSLGVRPTTNQSVMITNAGWKAVAIGPSTTANFPGAMTISDFTVSAPPGDANTLLLNYANTAVPLTVLGGLTVSTNGTLMTLSSGILIGSNGLSVAGGQVIQTGGFLHATNGTSKLGGTYNLTNASLRMDCLDVGTAVAGDFIQFKGQVGVSNLNLGSFLPQSSQYNSGHYDFQGGQFTSDLIMIGGGSFLQGGGTNHSKVIAVAGYSFGGPYDYTVLSGTYALDGGTHFAETMLVGDRGNAHFLQSGGVCWLTNGLSIRGLPGDPHRHSYISRYVNAGGTLIASNLDLNVCSSFQHSNGTTLVSGSLSGYGTFTYYPPETFFSLSGGFLGCSNLVCYSADFIQNGGTVCVTNLMRFSGSYCPGPDSQCSAAYRCTNGNLIARTVEILGRFMFAGGKASIAVTLDFSPPLRSSLPIENFISGGTLSCSNLTSTSANLSISGGAVTVSNTLYIGGLATSSHIPPPPYNRTTLSLGGGSLTASNIEMRGYMVLASPDSTPHLTNSGGFTLGGYLRCNGVNECLGRLNVQLAPDSYAPVLAFNDATNRLRFAASSAEVWATTTLIVTNWDGSLEGGGKHQLIFGTNAAGLTGAQLAQIRFTNPKGLPPGDYSANILPTSEIVPDHGPIIYPILAGDLFILSWSNATALQTSTNVAGPYLDIPSATSPYTNPVGTEAQRFFRLRQ